MVWGALAGGLLGLLGAKKASDDAEKSSIAANQRQRVYQLADRRYNEGRERKALARQNQLQDEINEFNSPKQMRKRFEAGGFNPLLGVGGVNSSYQGAPLNSFGSTGGSSGPVAVGAPRAQFGSIIQDAISGAIGQYTDKQALDIERTRVQNETRKLNERLKNENLNKKTAGIYGPKADIGSSGGNDSVVDGGDYMRGVRTATVDTAEDDPVQERMVENQDNISLVADGLDPVHGKIGGLHYSTINEETAEHMGFGGEFIKPIWTLTSIPVHGYLDNLEKVRRNKNKNEKRERLRDRKFRLQHKRGQDNFSNYRY